MNMIILLVVFGAIFWFLDKYVLHIFSASPKEKEKLNKISEKSFYEIQALRGCDRECECDECVDAWNELQEEIDENNQL